MENRVVEIDYDILPVYGSLPILFKGIEYLWFGL